MIVSPIANAWNYSTAPVDVQRQSLLDLVQRARGGLPIHLILWSLMGAMGGLATRVPTFFWWVACGFGASLACRMLVEPRIATLSLQRPKVARMLFLSLLLVNPAVWGATSALAVLWPPLNSASAWIWLVVTGIAASGGMSLAFDPAVRSTYAPLAVLPAAAGVFYVDSGQGLFEPVAAVIFLLYIYRASKVVHDDYWSAVQSRFELEVRARLLEHMSATDALTQVSNRMHFDRQLSSEWARARRSAPARSVMTVIMVDIDHFKMVNDSYGHPFGDLCLQAVASALRSALGRPGDLLARFGGEEFVAMLPSTDAGGASVVSARMHAAVAAMAIDYRGKKVKLTCSIGVHTMDALDIEDPSAAIYNADQALYQAKRGGRNRVVVFQATDVTSSSTAFLPGPAT